MRIVVMGVTGCGKSTVGVLLAARMWVEFADGDDFHAPDAVAKMGANVPLTDVDRWPWLERVGRWLAAREGAVVACSALRRSYRDAIRDRVPDVFFVHLAAPRGVLDRRVRGRAGHFAGPGLLDSQFATLEPLQADEAGVVVDVSEASAEDAALAAFTEIAGRG